MINSLTTLSHGVSAFYSFCPICLDEGEVPYFRKRWRLNCFLVCDRHPLQMQYRCEACGSPVSLEPQGVDVFISGHRKQILRDCLQCGQSLLSRKEARISDLSWQRLLRLQNKILAVLTAGTVSVTGIGVISAGKFLESYFQREVNDGGRVTGLIGLDFRRIFGIHRHALLAELSDHPGIALEDESEYVLYGKDSVEPLAFQPGSGRHSQVKGEMNFEIYE